MSTELTGRWIKTDDHLPEPGDEVFVKKGDELVKAEYLPAEGEHEEGWGEEFGDVTDLDAYPYWFKIPPYPQP